MQRTRFDKVIECREAFLYLRTDVRKYHGQAQTDVPHYRPSHQPSPFVLISNNINNTMCDELHRRGDAARDTVPVRGCAS